MKRLYFLILLVIILTFSGFGLDFKQYAVYNDIESGLKIATLLGKNTLLLLTLPDCGYCNQLKAEALTNKEVADLIRANCILIVAEADKTLFTRFPFEVFTHPEMMNFEIVNYFDLTTKKLLAKQVPHTVYINSHAEIVGAFGKYTDFASYFSSLKALIKPNFTSSARIIQNITDENATLLLRVLPQAKLVEFSFFIDNQASFDRYDYFILLNTDLSEVKKFVASVPNPPFNLLILDKNTILKASNTTK